MRAEKPTEGAWKRGMAQKMKNRILRIISMVLLVSGLVLTVQHLAVEARDAGRLKQQQRELMTIKINAVQMEETEAVREPEEREEVKGNGKDRLLPEYRNMQELNADMAGWLSIGDTVINYPVMQTLQDEEYYLYRDFWKRNNRNGSLILDTDSCIGTGTGQNAYTDGTEPSTNLIIHGHNMKSGAMFGELEKYADKEYGLNHRRIQLDSLYEKREYELMAVFYSQVYHENEDVFKYYEFFEADTEEEFAEWYRNVKKLALYETGTDAEYGDEFITLSCCTGTGQKDGRFVVIGRRRS